MGKGSTKLHFAIRKVYKRWIIFILFFILAGGITLLTKEFLSDQTVDQSQTVLTFTNKPEVSYAVSLKQNILYSASKQPEDMGYFHALIDSISVSMNNQYSGSDKADLKGDYMIKGEIIGIETGGDEPVIAWSKEFPIISKKEFSTMGNEMTMGQDAVIDYNHFSSFADAVDELTGYKTSHKLKVTMDINYTVTTSEGQAVERLQPSVLIPLGEKFFKISKAETDEKKGEITKTITAPAPPDLFKIIPISAVCLINTIALLLLLFRTEEPSARELQRKAAGKLLKEHGKRLVALKEDLLDQCSQTCSVHSMEDMIKISDEIERPIFYKYQKDLVNLREFYIIEKDRAYLYNCINQLDHDEDQLDQADHDEDQLENQA